MNGSKIVSTAKKRRRIHDIHGSHGEIGTSKGIERCHLRIYKSQSIHLPLHRQNRRIRTWRAAMKLPRAEEPKTPHQEDRTGLPAVLARLAVFARNRAQQRELVEEGTVTKDSSSLASRLTVLEMGVNPYNFAERSSEPKRQITYHNLVHSNKSKVARTSLSQSKLLRNIL